MGGIRLCFLILAILLPSPGWSFFLQNPVGHQESLLGNAGAGLPGVAGNPLYNPAGMAFYPAIEPAFSASGEIISANDSASNLYKNSTSSLTARSSLTAASFPLDDYGIRLAPFYSSPQSSSFYGSQDQTTGGTHNRTTGQITQESLVAGLAYSGPVTANLAWGFSVGVFWSEKETQLNTLSESAGQSSLVSSHDLQQIANIAFNPSVMWKVTDDYTVGLVGTLNPLNMLADGTTVTQSQQSGSSTGDQNFRRYSPDDMRISGITLGQSLLLADWDFLLDVSYFTQDPIQEKPTWQGAFGLRHNLIGKVDLLTGANYLKNSDYSQYFISGGTLITFKNYEFLLGVAYKRMDSSASVVTLQSDTLAFIFSSNITYSPK